jgi:hypothetical protein
VSKSTKCPFDYPHPTTDPCCYIQEACVVGGKLVANTELLQLYGPFHHLKWHHIPTQLIIVFPQSLIYKLNAMRMCVGGMFIACMRHQQTSYGLCCLDNMKCVCMMREGGGGRAWV